VAEPFLDSLKNVVPSLEKATEVSFILLLTSFVLLADCAAPYVHGMNILHLSEVPDVIRPRLAIEAVVFVIIFGLLVGVVMPFVLVIVNGVVIETAGRLWIRYVIWSDPDGRRFRPDSAYDVPVYSLRQKAHASKESYYLNLLKEADEEETEHWNKTRQTALFAFTVLVLSGVDFYAPLSPEGNGVLAQIADGLGQNGYGWLVCLGCILVVLAFYPIFEDRHPMVHCPELARELEKKAIGGAGKTGALPAGGGRNTGALPAGGGLSPWSALRGRSTVAPDVGGRLSNRTGGGLRAVIATHSHPKSPTIEAVIPPQALSRHARIANMAILCQLAGTSCRQRSIKGFHGRCRSVIKILTYIKRRAW
jgi:hypothetical protein